MAARPAMTCGDGILAPRLALARALSLTGIKLSLSRPHFCWRCLVLYWRAPGGCAGNKRLQRLAPTRINSTTSHNEIGSDRACAENRWPIRLPGIAVLPAAQTCSREPVKATDLETAHLFFNYRRWHFG